MTIKIINFKPIEVPGLLEHAKRFDNGGILTTNDHQFSCLDIDDAYIHSLYPYFQAYNPMIEKPDYFGEELVGAHITVFYPEESIILEEEDLGSKHHFQLLTPFSADLGLKRYFGLLVKSPELIEVRRKYGLGKKLQFKRYLVDLHITIGTIVINSEG